MSYDHPVFRQAVLFLGFEGGRGRYEPRKEKEGTENEFDYDERVSGDSGQTD